MRSGFELGKTYKAIAAGSMATLCKCVFVGTNGVTLQGPSGNIWTARNEDFRYYDEYVEPYFVVGDKYIGKNNGCEYECLWFDDEFVVMKYGNGLARPGGAVVEQVGVAKGVFLKKGE